MLRLRALEPKVNRSLVGEAEDRDSYCAAATHRNRAAAGAADLKLLDGWPLLRISSPVLIQI